MATDALEVVEKESKNFQVRETNSKTRRLTVGYARRRGSSAQASDAAAQWGMCGVVARLRRRATPPRIPHCAPPPRIPHRASVPECDRDSRPVFSSFSRPVDEDRHGCETVGNLRRVFSFEFCAKFKNLNLSKFEFENFGLIV